MAYCKTYKGSLSPKHSVLELVFPSVIFHSSALSSLAEIWINESSGAVFKSNFGAGHKTKIRALITGGFRSEKWRNVMEQLDSVNVFIFPMLKYKKWIPFLAPGYTLSCLERSDYLLTVRRRGLGGFAHQLITKHQKVLFIKTSTFADEKFHWHMWPRKCCDSYVPKVLNSWSMQNVSKVVMVQDLLRQIWHQDRHDSSDPGRCCSGPPCCYEI